jgi:hypothetical protein
MKKQDKITVKRSTSGQKENTTFSTSIPDVEPHLKTLAKHKHIYDLYVLTGELVNFHADIHDEVINAYRVVQPHYHYNRNCPACVCDMLKDVYNYYNKTI